MPRRCCSIMLVLVRHATSAAAPPAALWLLRSGLRQLLNLPVKWPASAVRLTDPRNLLRLSSSMQLRPASHRGPAPVPDQHRPHFSRASVFMGSLLAPAARQQRRQQRAAASGHAGLGGAVGAHPDAAIPGARVLGPGKWLLANGLWRVGEKPMDIHRWVQSGKQNSRNPPRAFAFAS